MAYPRITLLALLAAVALMVNGCVATRVTSPPSPAATSAPVFASEEEALAAATEAYAAYLAVGSQVARDGGAKPERMSEVTIGNAYEQEIEVFRSMLANSQVGEGEQTFDTVSAQSLNLDTGATTLYLCLDTRRTSVLDATGAVVNSPNRITRFPLQVRFVPNQGADRRLIIAESESWSGANFC